MVCFRLVIWFMQNLILRRRMSFYRDWWSCLIRSYKFYLLLLVTSIYVFVRYKIDHIYYILNSLCFYFVIQKWAEIIGQARLSVDFLKDQDVIRTVLNILQVWIFFRLLSFQSSFLHTFTSLLLFIWFSESLVFCSLLKWITEYFMLYVKCFC